MLQGEHRAPAVPGRQMVTAGSFAEQWKEGRSRGAAAFNFQTRTVWLVSTCGRTRDPLKQTSRCSRVCASAHRCSWRHWWHTSCPSSCWPGRPRRRGRACWRCHRLSKSRVRIQHRPWPRRWSWALGTPPRAPPCRCHLMRGARCWRGTRSRGRSLVAAERLIMRETWRRQQSKGRRTHRKGVDAVLLHPQTGGALVLTDAHSRTHNSCVSVCAHLSRCRPRLLQAGRCRQRAPRRSGQRAQHSRLCLLVCPRAP